MPQAQTQAETEAKAKMTYQDDRLTLYHSDCRLILPTLPAESVDVILCDPPYPEIDRFYGRLTEDEWWSLMMDVCRESRRILKLSGSAVFILQPNSRMIGSMRGWLFRFQAWCCDNWNIVQDVYWWNISAVPTVHCNRDRGLMRPSLKYCVWCGPADCYRNQNAVLLSQSSRNAEINRADRVLRYCPSGRTVRSGRVAAAADERGGVTPFNVIPIPNTDSRGSAGAYGHGAGTPRILAEWWVKYLCPRGGIVLDPFAGVGTIPFAATSLWRSAIGIEADDGYYRTMVRRAERPHAPIVRTVTESNDSVELPLFGAADHGRC